MEHQPSEVCDLMPCKLDWCQLKLNGWVFWSIKHNDELEYQRSINSIFSYSVVSSIFPTEKWRIQSVMEKIMWNPNISLFQFWAPIKVNGSTFLSTADQPFAFYNQLDKRLSSYRKLCLDTMIPMDNKEIPFGPPGRVFSRYLPEYNPNVLSYSSAEFPLLQTAIPLGIHSYYAFPVSNLHDGQCLGVFEIVSTLPYLPLHTLIKWLNFESVGLYIPNSLGMPFGPSKRLDDERLGDIKAGLYEILERHSLPFAQIWIPFSLPSSLKVLYRVGGSINERAQSMYYEFEYSSEVCFIKSGEALVGRAFASQGSCFCKDVTLLSINEYPVLPTARKARFTHSFAICLQSKCANNFVCVVEYFLPSNEMAVRDTKTFLNMLLTTMKELLPGFIVASGNELGQRMLVEVVKVSPNDELDSFEIGQTLPSVQSLQDGGETIAIDSFYQESDFMKKLVDALALVISSCSLDKCDSLNCEGTVEVDPSLPHPIEEAVTNRGTVNVDVAHDDHIEDTSEMMQLDSHFEQPNLEINSVGARSNDTVEHRDFSYARQSVEAEAINRENNFVSGAMTNNEKIHSQKNNELRRIEKDHGITRETLEQQYGTLLKDAAKNLGVSRATLKRICRVYEITRWPNHKTRKVNVHVSHGVSFQGAEPYVGDQQCPALSQEKGIKYLGNKRSPATGVSRDGVMTLKVTYRADMIKFQLSLLSTRVELEGEVEKRFKISRFSIKYQDEDDDWILITSDSDLRDGMNSLRLLGRNTMRLEVNPESDT
ncbi:protein NLP6-like isoform X1 [Solanum tuberosum]|nr:PREDICTED: protein NLP6-like isoform X1 [Solanum tuberosum]